MWKKTDRIFFRFLRVGWVCSLTATIALCGCIGGCISSVTNPESPEKKAPKLLDGDANNDGNVDGEDFQILKDNFGVGTAIKVPRYQQDAFLDIRQEDRRLQAIINMKTGEVKLVSTNGEEIALSGYQLISPGGAFLSPESKKPGFDENCGFLPLICVRNPVSAENLWNQGLATSSQFEVSDGDINAITKCWKRSVMKLGESVLHKIT